MKIYIDGCSLTYGQGLSREKSIGALFKDVGLHEFVVDKSRPGKSNNAIAYDAWENRDLFDVYILGFTYANRTYIKFRDQDIDLHLNSTFDFDYQKLNDKILENVCSDLHQAHYSLYDNNFYKKSNDMIVDTTIAKLTLKNKIVVPFSWEYRATDYKIFYPVYGLDHRISKTDHHLNEKGTRHLFDNLQLILLELRQNE